MRRYWAGPTNRSRSTRTGRCARWPESAAGRSSTGNGRARVRSEEHTSELQSLMRISYAVFCLKKKQLSTLLQQFNHLPRHIDLVIHHQLAIFHHEHSITLTLVLLLS